MAIVDDIIGQLPLMTTKERAAIKAAIILLERDKKSDNVEWLYDAACTVIGESLPYKVFLKTNSGSLWKDKAAVASNFIETNFASARQTARLAVTRMILKQLTKNLQSKGLTVTIGIIASNIDSLPAVFEQSFPGYIEAGLAHLVVESLTGGK